MCRDRADPGLEAPRLALRGRNLGRYSELVTILDLRTIKIRSGEQFHDLREVELEPLQLAGQRYIPLPETPEVEIAVSRVTSGRLFELAFRARLVGPCMRCLADAALELPVRAREYHATNPGDSDELTTPYIEDDKLDLSAWARDSLVLDLPDKILCRDDCAGLCPGCGADLNHEACTCGPEEPDTRWAALSELRDRL
jgi:uncharacterized protein